MLSQVLVIVALMCTGVVAGVQFAVALSVVPALLAMPPDRYIYTHRLLGRNYDPTLPLIVITGFVSHAVLAFVADSGRPLHAVASVLMIGVALVSHLCNVPINRAVKSLNGAEIPAEWPEDPRRLWMRWHLTRTTFAIVALGVTGFAVISA